MPDCGTAASRKRLTGRGMFVTLLRRCGSIVMASVERRNMAAQGKHSTFAAERRVLPPRISRYAMRLRLLPLVLLLATLCVSTASAAPTIPQNDSFANALPLPLTGNAKVKHAQLATTQVGEVTNGCDLPIANTVWFTL